VIDDGSTDGMCGYIQEKLWLGVQSSHDAQALFGRIGVATMSYGKVT
jgi:hypothetical protein